MRECYCVALVMINVSQIFLFILTDESSDECCSSALLLLVQHKTHLSEGTHSVLGLLRRLERVTISKLVSDSHHEHHLNTPAEHEAEVDGDTAARKIYY